MPISGRVSLTWIVVISTCLCVGGLTVTSQTLTNFFNSDIYLAYNSNIRPVILEADRVDVSVALTLDSITELDCLLGVLQTIGHLEVKWSDKRLSWKNSTDDVQDLKSIQITGSDIWTPPLVVANPFDDASALYSGNDVITIQNGGEVIWKPRTKTRSLCKTDVEYFPFDVQSCNISFGIAGYTKNEVSLNLISTEDAIGLNSLNKNTEWNIEESEVYQTSSTLSTLIHFELKMSRKPVYFVINLLLPVLLVTILSTSAFMIPAEEGRGQFVSIGFITLSFYFISTISLLPKASDTMTYIGYFFMWQMIYSVLVAVSAIFSLFLYFKMEDENIPKIFQRLVCCICKKQKKTKHPCKKPGRIMRIQVLPPDPERIPVFPDTHTGSDSPGSPACSEDIHLGVRYIYPGIDRQVSLQSQTSLGEVNGKMMEDCVASMETRIDRHRRYSSSSMSSNGSKVKRGRKVSPVLPTAEQSTEVKVDRTGPDLLHPGDRVRTSSNASGGSRSSQRSVHWSKQSDVGQNETEGFTNDKKWRTSINRSCDKHFDDKQPSNRVTVTHSNSKDNLQQPSIETQERGKTRRRRGIDKASLKRDGILTKSNRNWKRPDFSETKLSWKQVSRTLDKVFMVFFLAVNVLISTFFLFPLASRLL